MRSTSKDQVFFEFSLHDVALLLTKLYICIGKIVFPEFLDAMRVVSSPDSEVTPSTSEDNNTNSINDTAKTHLACSKKVAIEQDVTQEDASSEVELKGFSEGAGNPEDTVPEQNGEPNIAPESALCLDKKGGENIGASNNVHFDSTFTVENKVSEEPNRVSAGLAARMAKLGGVQGIKLPGIQPSASPKIKRSQSTEEVKMSAEITHRTLERVKVRENRHSRKISRKLVVESIDSLVTPIE